MDYASEVADWHESEEERPLYHLGKRVIDVTLALVILLVFSPVWLLIALLVKLTSPGPVLFAQREIGKGGAEFTLYKFRTMYANTAEDINRRFQEQFIKNGQHFATLKDKNGEERPVYKVVNDPRVTPLGRILRKTGLDEIPQLINVVKGEMSVVGPRPAIWYEYEHYSDWHKQRLRVLPGITGLHQVTNRSSVPFDEMVRLDLEYIGRRSLWLDLAIMLKTIPVLLWGRGAY
ncbi:MAG: sugar transferase [Bacteroidetes bacterium]|nr:sugar transferase [Bacteroidota bacterium]